MNSNKKLARIAGILYLVIFLGAGFSYGYIQSNILVPGNGAETVSHIAAAGWLYRFSFIAGLIGFLCDIAVAAIFYVLLAPVSKVLSLIAAFLRLVQTAILGVNMLNLLVVLDFSTGGNSLAAFDVNQLHSLALLTLKTYQYGFDIAMVFFGMHCLILGFLLFKSALFPRFLGTLMILAGFAYMADSFTKFLFPGHADITAWIVSIAAIIAELTLSIWLVVKGVRE
jgi:Domain of unknown function (DUF4386)